MYAERLPPLTCNRKQPGASGGNCVRALSFFSAQHPLTTTPLLLLLLQQPPHSVNEEDAPVNLPIKGHAGSGEGSDWLFVARRSV